MRMQLAGGSIDLPPAVLTLTNGIPFQKQQYVDQGYTDFEVVAVGAAAGRGGSFMLYIRGYASGNPAKYFYTGGSGGGGGLHRKTGLLANLPATVPVVIGSPGADVTSVAEKESSDSTSTYEMPRGGSGGYSSFNGAFCIASGGLGGQGARRYSYGPNPSDLNWIQGEGGSGGNAQSSDAGGGARGGYFPGNGTSQPGAEGTYDGTNGQGGGGGTGGFLVYDAYGELGNDVGAGAEGFAASRGGGGSTNGATYAGPGGLPTNFPAGGPVPRTGTTLIGGYGGGARLTPISGSLADIGTRAYGANGNGAVIIKLSRPAV